MGSLREEVNRQIDKRISETAEKSFKAGFYAGQAMAGVEIEECHANWKKLNTKSKVKKDNR